jgi:predicted Zn-dependent protease
MVALAASACAFAADPLWHGFASFFAPSYNFARWIENVETGSAVEKAMYRMMQLPAGEILFRRSPQETIPALTALQQSQKDTALYSLRALEEEQALNFDAAERDWKTWADQSTDSAAAHLDLADYYARRLQPQSEIAALEVVGRSATSPRERWTAAESQRAWLAWKRALDVVARDALPHAEAARLYAGWVQRYPQERSLYQKQFALLLEGKDFASASEVIAHYRIAFPNDHVFPVKAEADLAVKRGAAKDGLVVYERSFEPLWPPELVQNYFDLVMKSKGQRQFIDEMRANLAAHPDDLKDAARLFYLYQQQGRLDSAKAALSQYRDHKDARGAQWTAEELETLGRLYEGVQDYPEAARYHYALAADHATPGAEQKGVVGLARILLAAPEQPLRVGAGNLALYKSIATMDRGPGYLNGILSLFLNTQGPRSEYANEDRLAIPYFHRARAAELIAEIDHRFPDEPERAKLHAALMDAYAAYGENDSVIREGASILAGYPAYHQRVSVALTVADAYARTQQTDKEFTLYQSMLKELAAGADGVPLGDGGSAYSRRVGTDMAPDPEPIASVEIGYTAHPAAPARSAHYAQTLDRYLARLVALHRLPDAVAVLRGELDRNPQDPGLYERLANFLEQNALNANEEAVYQRAVEQFQDTNWYGKLARYYLREKRNSDYNALTRKVAGIFTGTDLEVFLDQAPAPDRTLALQVNLHAHQRFPHDLRFVERLIFAYNRNGHHADAEKLLWEHWSESSALRNQLFELLSKNGQLGAQLDVLRTQAPEIERSDWTALASRNPAAERFWMEACLWQSHFELCVAPADALAATYPADRALGDQAASLYRSLAYFHSEDTDKSVAIEKRLLQSEPGNLEILASIGDIYADRQRFAEASPFWMRMSDVHPGEPDGYLQSATVYWDYFNFNDAQAQLQRARSRLGDPALFGYQAGAIAESRGDIASAVREYVSSALVDKPSAESRDRLYALARRPADHAFVEDGTSSLLKRPDPATAAIQLRAGILQAENRRPDLDSELKQAIAQTSSFDVLDAISEAARSHALQDVEEAAFTRQIAITNDPVRNLQLRYQLVDLYQKGSQLAATHEIDAIYRDHPKIVGVVRSTVDYDWGHDRKPQAVAVLLESSKASYPDLKNKFQLEAARKLTDLGEYAKSRAIIESLLADNPLDSGYEAAMADNFARSNDSSGLQMFYTNQLSAVQKSSMERSEKMSRIAQLRRGIVSAFTELGNFNGAAQQYIELINAYPDDESLTQEAALYAEAHHQRDTLFGFYQKTIASSPRDPRWSIVLARLATAAEQYPIAIDAYDKAIRLRPERQDLYVAQASLQEHLHRLDDAANNYQRIYVLSYHDPQWMVKIAELRARQGRSFDAVKALETGWIEGRPAKAANSFAAADRLEKWGLLNEARTFAEQGIDQAGNDLLVDPSTQNGVVTYARILARQRQFKIAFSRLTEFRQKAGDLSLQAVVQQVAKDGPGAVTSDEWRKQRAAERSNAANKAFAQALLAMGQVAAEFYTPEETADFASWMQQRSETASNDEVRTVYLPAIKAAHLTDLDSEVTWNLLQHDRQLRNEELPGWIQLQQQRGLTVEAAARLERLASSLSGKQRASVWQNAADTYRMSGDTAGELRSMQHLSESRELGGEELDRYYQLLLERQPQQLDRQASNQDSAAQYLVRNGTVTQAIAGINARSITRSPVWKSAYTGLSGLYLREHSGQMDDAFAKALGTDLSIGDRIAHPVDRNQQLAGTVWFYYGSRYAEYLDDAKDPRAQDYLDSELELRPASSEAYLRLADYSAQTKRFDPSLSDYRQSLELKRDQPAVLDKIAVIDWQQGRKDEALARWSDAVGLLAEEMDARRVPETFWGDFSQVLSSVSAHGQYDSIRQAIDTLLRTYIARNGSYRVESLVEAGYHANHNSVAWLLNITSSAKDQAGVLNALLPGNWDVTNEEWIQKDQISEILMRIVELDKKGANEGVSDDGVVVYAQQRLLAALIDEKQYSEAATLLERLPENVRNRPEWLPGRIAVAESEGKLDALLQQWKKAGTPFPSEQDLRGAIVSLSAKARHSVMRFVYERALDGRELTAPNFLGLAAIRLDDGDTAGAVQLLKRLTLMSDNVYADIDAAAHLLEQRHKDAEALEFLRPLAESSPWDAGYKVRLATAMLAVDHQSTDALGQLRAAIADPNALYADRISAARALDGKGASESGSGELTLLAQSSCPSPDAASKSFFVQARVKAAGCATNVKVTERLLHDALAIAPQNVSIRLKYVLAAFDAGADSRAMVAAKPYLEPNNDYGQVETPDDTHFSDATSWSELDEPRGLSLTSLNQEDLEKITRFGIRAYVRKHDLHPAVLIAQRTIPLLHDPAHRTTMIKERERFDLEIARGLENAARAPAIHAELDQDHIVQPRLLPDEPFTPKPSSDKENQE